MTRYTVEVKETRTLTFEVEASSADEAVEIALDSDDFVRDMFDERILHSVAESSEQRTTPDVHR